MTPDGIKFAACSCVVRVPRLLDRGELSFELADERKESESINEHGNTVSLRDAFLAIEEGAGAVVDADHECPPVPVAVESKPGSGGPLMPNGL